MHGRSNQVLIAIQLAAIVTLFVLTGCASKRSAEQRAKAAFDAGQQQAAQMQQSTERHIHVSGNVRNPRIEWVDGMSLAQAIVAAEYLDHRDPIEILIIRRGHVIPINPKDLLRGRDHFLEPGDRIQLHR